VYVLQKSLRSRACFGGLSRRRRGPFPVSGGVRGREFGFFLTASIQFPPVHSVPTRVRGHLAFSPSFFSFAWSRFSAEGLGCCEQIVSPGSSGLQGAYSEGRTRYFSPSPSGSGVVASGDTGTCSCWVGCGFVCAACESGRGGVNSMCSDYCVEFDPNRFGALRNSFLFLVLAQPSPDGGPLLFPPTWGWFFRAAIIGGGAFFADCMLRTRCTRHLPLPLATWALSLARGGAFSVLYFPGGGAWVVVYGQSSPGA